MLTVNRDDVWRTVLNGDEAAVDLKFEWMDADNGYVLDLEELTVSFGDWKLDQVTTRQVLEIMKELNQ